MTKAKLLTTSASKFRGRRLPGRSFLRDCSGTTAIEFAMISVPFFGLLGAIFETGSVYFRTAQLQMATESASRALLTHSLTGATTNQSFINSKVCTWKTKGTVDPGTLSTMFDCSKLIIDVKNMGSVWSTVDATGMDLYNTPPPSGGALPQPAAGQIAIVRIVYPMTSIFTILGGGVFSGQKISPVTNGYASGNVHVLLGMAAFRVEP